MHNGNLGNFSKVRRHLLAGLSEPAFDFAVEHGGSDTALCFAVFLSLIDDPMAQGSPDKLRACLSETVRIVERALIHANANETSLLNFVVSDGESMAASRYVIDLRNPNAAAASLYYASGTSYQSDGSAPGNYAMMHTDRRPSLVIVSSEPLTERRADWVAVPRNACLVVTKSMHILVSPLEAKSDAVMSRVLTNLDAEQAERIPSNRRSVRRGAVADNGVVNCNVVGSTVRATITIPGKTALCCVIMGSLLCSGTDDGSIHVWNMEENTLSEVFRTGRRPVLAMVAHVEEGILVCATSASVVALYRLTPEKKFEATFVMCCEGTGDILSLTKIGKKVFAGFSDAKVRCIIEDLTTVYGDPLPGKILPGETSSDHESCVENGALYTGGEFPRELNCASHFGHVFAMASCLGGRFLCTGSGDGLLRIWDVESQECVQKRDDHTGAILTLVAYEVEQGTMLFSGSRDHTVKVWVWDGDNGFLCKRTLRKHRDEIVFLSVLGNMLVSGSADGHLCVWSVETLAPICQYRDKSLKAGSVSLRHNLLFTASSEGSIQMRDFISTGRDVSRRESLKGDTSVATKSAVNGAIETKMPANGTITASRTRSPTDIATNGTPLTNGIKSNGDESSQDSNDMIVTEIHEHTDDAETLVLGVTNEMVLPPPMSPMIECEKNRSQLISTLLDGKGLTGTDESALGEGGDMLSPGKVCPVAGECPGYASEVLEKRLMQDVLARFVSFPTVSGHEDHREDCWQGARYISTFLEGLGATVKFAACDGTNSGTAGSNPVVLAKFSAVNPAAKTVAFYGHYDVMPVDESQWKSDPWSLTSMDGYFYGRGATDNKGPIIAMIFAIKKLVEENRDGLGNNIVLVLQGEGETANKGFKECIESHLHWFDNTSLILTSNSNWLGEEKPCITYSFRGIIELRVSVTGGARNLHSGVDGGALYEPMNDLITILGTLVDASGVVCVPGFYDDVRPLTDADRDLLRGVDFDIEEYHKATGVQRFTADQAAEVLEARWRKPSVSITCIDTSNESGFLSVVPRRATAKVSVRFVPDQDPAKIEKAIAAHLGFEIRKRRSPNKLTVECVNKGDWWLGDPSEPHFQIAERAMRSVWGVTPEYVCEGGSMPVFSYLVKTLGAPLVQVPLGQSSDGAHLPNERLRALNFFKGKKVLQKIIEDFEQSGL